ncbi:RluA family pseudouridine synthase [Alicyclobacillus cycloheptanicus]|uniref:Pseudouridine synthase n=1 Tax=Alicyclobacillus cycloheptanicus TaxID=1457 RepID=A0ABT9XJ36_9BACL|nr:RluA family pseudouridine synthase [Alicyclobacillus cycloheptanicus]MDQ0189736.1 23S rRNA pseudouridine1911/1915/1917 synthase [Alicyclobacillus cycloheptanicus]WDM01946.1 RluA family pseudouridine synthase [Alicyclobacillus cycloheptanicus]
MTQEKQLTVHEPATLLPFLLARLSGKGRNKVKSLLTHRLVLVDGRVVTRHDHPLQPGQTVTVLAGRQADKDALLGVRILYEDDDLIVIDKPPGLLSIAAEPERERTAYHVLTAYVQRRDGQGRIFVVHRLDRDTSGVMMFAKRETIQQRLQENWHEMVTDRVYVAVVEGTLSQPEGRITSWLKESKTKTMYVARPGDGQKAVLHYRVLQQGPSYALVEVRLDTGRKNQIRVQMQSIGHSVAGDKRYGARKNPLGRLALHARVLAFRHPVTGQEVRFETPIPASFRRLVSSAGE